MGFGPGYESRLGGRYRLLELIGSGGMGRVYRAHDEVLDRAVAVKVLDAGPSGGALGPACAAEARLAASLSHPAIARIFDSGVEDGRCFVVMELVPGRPLAEVLRESRVLPPLASAELVAEIADALEDAHRQGIIHCDVKPHNIIVSPDGRPKLVDFGIARALNATTSVRPDEVMGSAPYLAPEQARGERLDAGTDVYALGAVLYELLTGRPPFTGRSAAEIIAQKLTREPVAPRSLNPNIPPELEGATLVALAVEPARRYRSAGDFRDALRGAARRNAEAARAGTAPVHPPLPIDHPAARAEGPAAEWPRARGSRAGLGAVAILLVGAVVAAVIVGRAGSQDRVTPQGAILTPIRPTAQPTPERTAARSIEATAAPLLAPAGRPTGGGEGNRGGGEAEQKAPEEPEKKPAAGANAAEDARKKAEEEARKKAEEEAKKAEDERKKAGDKARKKAEAKGQRGGRN